MVIKEEDFELRQVSDSSSHWDLSLMRVINAKSKTKEARKELQVEGYGYTLDGAMTAIARYRMSMKYPDKALTMREYLDSYTKELHKLYELVGETPNNLTLMEE